MERNEKLRIDHLIKYAAGLNHCLGVPHALDVVFHIT